MSDSGKDHSSSNPGLRFTEEEYVEWHDKFEAGYGQPRPGVCAAEVLKERLAIPTSIRHTYMADLYFGKISPELRW